MIDYKAPLDDFLFTLRHGAGADRLPHWDDDLAREVLGQAAALVEKEIAPLDPVGDAKGTHLVEGRARMPREFVRAYDHWREAGWPGMAMDERFGGMELPHVLASAVSEMLSGACISYQMILSLGQGAMRTIAAQGSEDQKARYLPTLASGEWLATMCLTEPQAGSDLGLSRTMARPQDDGSWRISGSKIFISGGDQDLTENIIHLVLARTPDAPPGTRGLSLFICPAMLPDGSRNGVSAVRLEEKMGMHASPTCQLAFDDAWAEIVGAPGEGLARMFTMMNAERLDVAMQGVGLAQVAVQRSTAYAFDRRQGRAGNDWPVEIARHPDVRRMLLTQASLAFGLRAIVQRTIVDLELDEGSDLVEFMTPVCKAFATDAAVQAADLAIQIHGGYGYLREYRVEQICRDARITQIYEGTNGIQAATLTGRLLRLKDGAVARAFAEDVETAAVTARNAGREEAAQATARLLNLWSTSAAALNDGTIDGRAVPFLRLTALTALMAAYARLEAGAEAENGAVAEKVFVLSRFARDWLGGEAPSLAALITSSPDLPTAEILKPA